MATGNQRRAAFISHKLQFLKDQGSYLIDAIEIYTKSIITSGELWTKGEDQQMEYLVLCEKIDTAVDFLCEKCEELANMDRSGDVAANQIAQQQELTSQSIQATASTLGTSCRESTGSLASTTIVYRQPAESVQPADQTQLKQVLFRMSVIEEAMSSFQSTARTVVEQQTEIDKQLKELVSRVAESDKKHSSKVRKVKGKISEIIDTQDSINEEHKTRLHTLEKQLQKVSAAQDRLIGKVESHAELSKELAQVPDLLKSTKGMMDALDTKIHSIIDSCSQKHEVLENVMQDLEDKVMANKQNVQVISEGQDQRSTVLNNLQTRLQSLEAHDERNVHKQAEEGETNFRILCKMLNDRLTPLEKLRTCLNQRAIVRDANITKLTQVIQEVAVMSPRLQKLELSSLEKSYGFSAQAMFTGEVVENTIRGYEIKYSNVGANFDADKGMFRAPVDGLYVTSISLSLSEKEEVQVDVKYKQVVGNSKGSRVCESLAMAKHTTSCGVGVIGMKAGDILFSSVYRMDKNKHSKVVSFSCFLLR